MEGMTIQQWNALSKADQEILLLEAKQHYQNIQKSIGMVTNVREARKRINVIAKKSGQRDSSLSKEEGICQMCGQKEEYKMHTCRHCQCNLCHQCLETASSTLSVDFDKQIAAIYCESCVEEVSDTELETGQYFTRQRPHLYRF